MFFAAAHHSKWQSFSEYSLVNFLALKIADFSFRHYLVTSSSPGKFILAN
jgi:hypothetical protein